MIESDMRQFQNKTYDIMQRFVENLVSGNFMKVSKDVDLSVQRSDTTAGIKASR